MKARMNIQQMVIDSILLTVVGSIVAYCVGGEEPGANQAARPGLPTERLTVTTVDGRSFGFNARHVTSNQISQSALITVASFKIDEAMLFTFDQPMPITAWIKNSAEPEDVIFIRPDETIAAAVPDSMANPESVGTTENVSAILEIQGGLAKEIGLGPGGHVYYREGK